MAWTVTVKSFPGCGGSGDTVIDLICMGSVLSPGTHQASVILLLNMKCSPQAVHSQPPVVCTSPSDNASCPIGVDAAAYAASPRVNKAKRERRSMVVVKDQGWSEQGAAACLSVRARGAGVITYNRGRGKPIQGCDVLQFSDCGVLLILFVCSGFPSFFSTFTTPWTLIQS